MKVSRVIEVIKGQEVLPDGSTLDEHGIIDGSTVNIDIKPYTMVNLRVKLGPAEFSIGVHNSMRVDQFKEHLVYVGCVRFQVKDFCLLVPRVYNHRIGFSADVVLQDESLPLYLWGIKDKTIEIIGGRITVKLVNQKGKTWYKTFSKNVRVVQMKQTILSTDTFFSADEDRNLVKDVWLYMQCGASYTELDDEMPIGSKLSDDSVVYLIEDRFFPEVAVVTVYYDDYVPPRKIGPVAYSDDDTVLSVKLCVQAQFGFPVSCVRVSSNECFNLDNDKTIHKDLKYRISVE